MGLSVSLTCLCSCKIVKLYIASPLLWHQRLFQSVLYTNKELAKLHAFFFFFFLLAVYNASRRNYMFWLTEILDVYHKTV